MHVESYPNPHLIMKERSRSYNLREKVGINSFMQWHPCMHYKTNKLNNISSTHHGRDLSLAIHKEQKGLYKLWLEYIYLFN